MEQGNSNEGYILKTEDPKYEPNNKGLGNELFHSLKRHKSKISQYVADTGETDTFENLLKRSIRTALKLKSKGITRDDIVCICSHNHMNNIVPFIASLFLGIKVASLDPSQSIDDYKYLLELVSPKIIFVSVESFKNIKLAIENAGLDTEIVVFGSVPNYPNFTEEFLQVNVEEENKFEPTQIKSAKETAIILFSSGTTGLPKGICLSHYALMGQSVSFLEQTNVGGSFTLTNYEKKTDKGGRTDLPLVYTTLYWITGVICVLVNIFSGLPKLVCPGFNTEKFWEIVPKYKVTHMMLTPSQCVDILKVPSSKKSQITSLKYMGVGGSAVAQNIMEEMMKSFPATNIFQGYGQTEVAGMITFFKPEDHKLQLKKLTSCGLPVSGFSYKVVDLVTEQPLGPNQEGELRYKSKWVMNGYHKLDATSAFDSDGWLKTGDVAYYDEDKCFFLVDRIKEMFKYRDWHIQPVMLENILITHPAVREAVVFGKPHDIDGAHPMAAVLLNKNYENVSPEEIEKFVEERVSDRQRLRAGVLIVNEIPKTPTGKLMRRVIRDRVIKNLLK